MMKTLIPLTFVLSATSALADGYASQTAVVVDVDAVYSTAVEPVAQEQCFETQVPVYGMTQGSAGDALLGAIIGGAIGNQFGSGSGQEAATVLGAIVGANQATQPSRGVVGYSSEWRCEMVYVNHETQIFHHYQVTYELHGKYYRINTDELYEVGQRIVINQ